MEIKFKLYDKVKKKIILSHTREASFYTFNINGSISECNSWCSSEVVLLIYTGLKDTSDRDIYNMDIIQCGNEGEKFIIKWNNYLARFTVTEHNPKKRNSNKEFIYRDNITKQLVDIDKYKVIGNYYSDYNILIYPKSNKKTKVMTGKKNIVRPSDWDMNTTIKYIIHPGNVVSKKDGGMHFISYEQLINLYKLNPKECVPYEKVIGNNKFGLNEVMRSPEFTNLYPRKDGNYKL